MTPRFEIADAGFIHRCETGIAAQPRLVTTAAGDVLCHYVLQSSLGQNDFQPTWSRSRDGGQTWAQGKLWPHLQRDWSMIGAAGRASNGRDLVWLGSRWRMGQPGETFWSNETQGLKQNDIIWAISRDDGWTWTDPAVIPNPLPGSVEICAAMCVTRNGEWIASYAPYNTWDPNLKVPRNQVVALTSVDQGKTWQHAAMLHFPHSASTAAGAWVSELSDGRVLGIAWHINETFPADPPNAYAISRDGGRSWSATMSTGILGQTTCLAPLDDGRVLFIYNQRKQEPAGVYLALARPTENDFGMEANELIWRAERPTRHGTSGNHSEWTDMAFGGPSIVALPDGTALAAWWCHQPSGTGIRYLKLKLRTA